MLQVFSIRKRKERGRSISVTCYFQIKHADRKSYLKRQEKEKVLCVNASRRKMGNSAQQIRRIVSSEKSHIKYYSNHLCVRNLGIMSLHFTNTGPEPAPAEWAGTSATNSSGLQIGSVGSLGAPVKLSRMSSLHTSRVISTLNLCPLHLVTPPHRGFSWGTEFISGHQVPRSHSHLSSLQEGEAECPELRCFPKLKAW